MSGADAPDPRKVAEAALAAFVYVPLGLALEARDLIPKLAERGRNQILLARFGARVVRKRAEAETDRIRRRVRPGGPASGPAAPPPPPPPAAAASPATHRAPPPPPAPTRPVAPDRSAATTARPPIRPAGARKASAGGGGGVRADALAIPGYDTLSASQVIPRLDALRPDELVAVGAYEAAHRGRRTILSRVAQLQR